MGLIENEKQYLKTIIHSKKFSDATEYPLRYIDIILVKYGQNGKDKEWGLKNGICLSKNPYCQICKVKYYCNYFKNNKNLKNNINI